MEWFAEEAKRAEGQVIPSPNVEQQLIAIRQPVGVVAAITPWNFPSAMITRKIGPALAAGCTVVLKPAAQTPLSALAIASLAEEAGLPNGVLNIVTGNAREIGAELTSNEVVRKLSFTGSTEIGRTLYRQCANTIKKLSLELGGNAPFIIFPDADIDAAVAGAIASKFRNAGQTCVCVNRFYVHDDIYDLFSKKLAERVSTLRVGHGLAYDTDIGPLIDAAAVHKVEEHIQNAISLGATLLVGGTRVNMDHTYFQPTVLTDVTHDMLITKEETFGPVAAIIRFTDEKEVIEQANNSELGLASYFYSNNHSQIWRVAQAIEAGMVGINTGQISSAAAPFGGIKQSGLGREGSRFGLDDYTEIKYLCLNTGSWKP